MSNITFTCVRQIELYYDIITLKRFPDIEDTIVEIFNGKFKETPKRKYEKDGDILYVLGVYYSVNTKKLNFNKSVRLWNQALENNNYYAHGELAKYYENTSLGNDNSIAIKHLLKGIMHRNDYCMLLHARLYLNKLTEHRELCRRFLTLTIETNDRNELAWYYFGLYYLLNEDIVRAESCLAKSFMNGYMPAVFLLLEIYKLNREDKKYLTFLDIILNIFVIFDLDTADYNKPKLSIDSDDNESEIITFDEMIEYKKEYDDDNDENNDKFSNAVCTIISTINVVKRKHKPYDSLTLRDLIRASNFEDLYPSNLGLKNVNQLSIMNTEKEYKEKVLSEYFIKRFLKTKDKLEKLYTNINSLEPEELVEALYERAAYSKDILPSDFINDFIDTSDKTYNPNTNISNNTVNTDTLIDNIINNNEQTDSINEQTNTPSTKSNKSKAKTKASTKAKDTKKETKTSTGRGRGRGTTTRGRGRGRGRGKTTIET